MRMSYKQKQPHFHHWLQLIYEAELQNQAWKLRGYYNQLLRNESGACPLCALARSVDPDCQYKLSWKLAIRKALGDFGDIDDTILAELAEAADGKFGATTHRGYLKLALYKACMHDAGWKQTLDLACNAPE